MNQCCAGNEKLLVLWLYRIAYAWSHLRTGLIQLIVCKSHTLSTSIGVPIWQSVTDAAHIGGIPGRHGSARHCFVGGVEGNAFNCWADTTRWLLDSVISSKTPWHRNGIFKIIHIFMVENVTEQRHTNKLPNCQNSEAFVILPKICA